MSGTRLAAALVAILLLTFVVPPLAAKQVHQRRIGVASADVARLAADLAVAGGGADAGRLYRGPGDLPKSAPGVTWVAGVPIAPLPALVPGVGPDPWGNHYLAIVNRGAQVSVIVLSAGPNGLVETAEDDMAANPIQARGDDILNARTEPGAG